MGIIIIHHLQSTTLQPAIVIPMDLMATVVMTLDNAPAREVTKEGTAMFVQIVTKCQITVAAGKLNFIVYLTRNAKVSKHFLL